MSFSQEWDHAYQAGTHLSVWPWSDLISLVMRYARPRGSGFRVLELGCGAGANIPFFQGLGVDYHAVEGSAFMAQELQRKVPELGDRIVALDFTKALPFEGEFDLIVDRASLTHNTTDAIRQCLALVHDRLKVGGHFIGVDWFSTRYSDFQAGLPTDDPYTRTGYTDRAFAHLGNVHFSDRPHLLDLFKAFSVQALEHKFVERELPADGWSFASWNIVARKEA